MEKDRQQCRSFFAYSSNEVRTKTVSRKDFNPLCVSFALARTKSSNRAPSRSGIFSGSIRAAFGKVALPKGLFSPKIVLGFGFFYVFYVPTEVFKIHFRVGKGSLKPAYRKAQVNRLALVGLVGG